MVVQKLSMHLEKYLVYNFTFLRLSNSNDIVSEIISASKRMNYSNKHCESFKPMKAIAKISIMIALTFSFWNWIRQFNLLWVEWLKSNVGFLFYTLDTIFEDVIDISFIWQSSQRMTKNSEIKKKLSDFDKWSIDDKNLSLEIWSFFIQ